MSPFAQFRPDLAETNAVSTNVLNVVLRQDGQGVAYGPMPGIALTATATALPANPKGGVSLVNRNGDYFAFVGTSSNLYRFNQDSTWTSVGSGYSLTSGDKWSMIGYGNFLLATNTTDGLQQYNVEAGGSASLVANSYFPRFLFTAFDCVFGGNCIDGTGVRDNRLLRNSAINDYTIWTAGVGGAGTQVFPDGEELIGGAELSQNLAVVFQRNAIRALVRTGDSSIYSVQTIVTGEGAVNPQCIATIGGVAYFLDTDGFKAVSSGGVVKIGDGKVDNWFLARLASGGLDTVEAAIDPSNKRIVWRYSTSDANAAVFDSALAYHYTINEWVPLTIDTAAIFAMGSPAYDMDAMDTAFPSMDAITIDMDSRFWSGGEPQLFAIGSDLKGGYFSGPNLAATLETGTVNSPRGALLRSLTPITDSANATVAIGYRDSLSLPKTYSSEFGIQRSGRSMARARGKNLSIRLSIPASETWTFARGVDAIEFQQGGVR